jgi:hypothetical protein
MQFIYKYKFIADKKMPHKFVYGWRRQKGWLYVGSTTVGTVRFYSHCVVRGIEECDELHIWYATNEFCLLQLEQMFITLLHPSKNQVKKLVPFASHKCEPDVVLKAQVNPNWLKKQGLACYCKNIQSEFV